MVGTLSFTYESACAIKVNGIPGTFVAVGVNVTVGGSGVLVTVGTAVLVGVFVGVGGTGVLVAVGDGPTVLVFVGGTGVLVAVGNGVFVSVGGTAVLVGVGVGPEEGAVISYILPSIRFGSLLLSMPRSTM